MRDMKYLRTRWTMSVEDLAHYYIGHDNGATGSS